MSVKNMIVGFFSGKPDQVSQNNHKPIQIHVYTEPESLKWTYPAHY